MKGGYSASSVWNNTMYMDFSIYNFLHFKSFESFVTKVIYKWITNFLTIRVRGLVLLYFKFSLIKYLCRSVFGSACIYFAFRFYCWMLCFFFRFVDLYFFWITKFAAVFKSEFWFVLFKIFHFILKSFLLLFKF